jgi:hypothetical protein
MATSVRMSSVVQGVELQLIIGGKLVRALVTPDALEKHFRATAAPASWLEACSSNLPALNAVVLKRWEETHKEPLVLLARDF